MIDIAPLIQAIAVAVADELERRGLVRTSARFASAKNNPLGTPRAFLDAGRRGAFPTFKRGREVVAEWGDVERYIMSRAVKQNPRPTPRGVVLDPNGTTEQKDAYRLASLMEAGAVPVTPERKHLLADLAEYRAAHGIPARRGRSRRPAG